MDGTEGVDGDVSGEEAAWRDLIARFDLPVDPASAPAPWPAREDLIDSAAERRTQEHDGRDVRGPATRPGSPSRRGPASLPGPAELPGATGRPGATARPGQDGRATEPDDAGTGGAGPGGAGPGGTGPGGTGPGAAGPGAAGPGAAGTADPDAASLDSTDLANGADFAATAGLTNADRGNAGLDSAGLDSADLGNAGLDISGLSGTGLNSADLAWAADAAAGETAEADRAAGLGEADTGRSGIRSFSVERARIIRRAVPPPTQPQDDDEDEDEDDEDYRYRPPPPEPLPQLDPVAKAAWLGLLGGPAYLLISTLAGRQLSDAVALLAIAAFIAGGVTLFWRMGDKPPDDDDDGAVV